MQIIHREIKTLKEPENLKLEYIGYNNMGVFSIMCEGGIIINICGDELNKIRKFIKKMED